MHIAASISEFSDLRALGRLAVKNLLYRGAE